MTLRDVSAECERHETRMDSSHERMDKFSSQAESGNPNAKSSAPQQVPQYPPHAGGPRPVVIAVAVIVILLVIFAAALVFILFHEESPTDVYMEYVDASNDRDIKRMFDQTVTRFTSDYEERLEKLGDGVFYLNPKTDVLKVGVIYQANLTQDQKFLAQIIVDDIESQLLVQIDDFCYVNYRIIITYTDIDQSALLNGQVLCVSIDGQWYLAVPGFY